MARPRKFGDRVTTAVRVPVDLHERLAAVADDRDTSINNLIVKAADYYLEHVIKPMPTEARSG